MAANDYEKTTQHVKTGFGAIRTKLHLDEVASDIVEVVANFHRHVGKFLEHATKQIPIINMLIEAIGNVAAVVNYRKKKTTFEKQALGVKVTAGLITTAITIAAFAVPHVSVPLIVAGSAINLGYSYFSIYKVYHRKKILEKELKQTPITNESERHTIEHKITELKAEITEHKEHITHKTVSTVVSTIALLGMIIMLANPITVLPVSIILAVTAVAYTAYHFRKPIISGFKRLGNAIKRVFTSNPKDGDSDQLTDKDINQKTVQHQAAVTAKQTDSDILQQAAQHQTAKTAETTFEHKDSPEAKVVNTVTPQPTAHTGDFLHHQENVLEHESAKSADSYQAHHQPKPVPTITVTKTDSQTHTVDLETTDFLQHEEQALSSIATKSDIPTIKVTDADEEEDDDGGEGGGEGEINAAKEERSMPEPQLRM